MTLDYGKYFDNLDGFADQLLLFQALSTIRYDPLLSPAVPASPDKISIDNFFLLQEHVERLKFTMDFFTSLQNQKNHTTNEYPYDITLKLIFDQLKSTIRSAKVPLTAPLKVRLLMDLEGRVQVELHEVPEKPNLLGGLDSVPDQDRYDVYVDLTPVLLSPFTSFKTTLRDVYSKARAKLPGNRPGKEEVLLSNTIGELMEGSITSVAIKNEQGHWVTPKLTSGCLCGVTRHMLLKKKAIAEATVLQNQLVLGQDVLLLNAIGGAMRGTIKGFLS